MEALKEIIDDMADQLETDPSDWEYVLSKADVKRILRGVTKLQAQVWYYRRTRGRDARDIG